MGHLKDALLAAAAERRATAVVEGEGGTIEVLVREPTTQDIRTYGTLQATGVDEANAVLLASCVIDEKGKPLFTAEEAATVARQARTCLPVVNKILELGGLGKDRQKHPDAS